MSLVLRSRKYCSHCYANKHFLELGTKYAVRCIKCGWVDIFNYNGKVIKSFKIPIEGSIWCLNNIFIVITTDFDVKFINAITLAPISNNKLQGLREFFRTCLSSIKESNKSYYNHIIEIFSNKSFVVLVDKEEKIFVYNISNNSSRKYSEENFLLFYKNNLVTYSQNTLIIRQLRQEKRKKIPVDPKLYCTLTKKLKGIAYISDKILWILDLGTNKHYRYMNGSVPTKGIRDTYYGPCLSDGDQYNYVYPFNKYTNDLLVANKKIIEAFPGPTKDKKVFMAHSSSDTSFHFSSNKENNYEVSKELLTVPNISDWIFPHYHYVSGPAHVLAFPIIETCDYLLLDRWDLKKINKFKILEDKRWDWDME